MVGLPQYPAEWLDADGNVVSFATREEARAFLEADKARDEETLAKALWLADRGLPLDTSDERIAEIEDDELCEAELEAGVETPDLDENYEDL